MVHSTGTASGLTGRAGGWVMEVAVALRDVCKVRLRGTATFIRL